MPLEDVFFPMSNVFGPTPVKGDVVSFAVAKTAQRLCAVEVSIVNEGAGKLTALQVAS